MLDDRSSMQDVNDRIARRVRALRGSAGLSLEAMAARCDVSRSMLSLIERGESSPTAVVLDRIATGLNVPLASLFAGAPEETASPVARRERQLSWRDPGSGYVRRNVSPEGYPSPIRLVEVDFPAGARVAYETGQREAHMHQQVWVLAGSIEVQAGDDTYRLETGDCLAMELDRPVAFRNDTADDARYAVVIAADPR
jgi:transcriptional regulator with XRE-family HTH domain